MGTPADFDRYVAEHLSDGTWRTVKEIAAPKDATDPGIGANDRTIAEVLEANPDTFESRTGKANRELGRHPSAMLWKVRQTSSAPDAALQSAAEE